MGGVHKNTQSSLFIYSFIYLFIYLFTCIWDVKSTLIQLSKTKFLFSQQKRKWPSLPFRTSNLLISATKLYTTLLIQLSYLTVSISHPILLSAANHFSYFKLSVFNPSYLSPTVSWMYVDTLNLRQTVPNCPQLTPAIAPSVVPTMFSYKMLRSLEPQCNTEGLYCVTVL